MRPAKLHEYALPSPFVVWSKYTQDTPLQNKMGPMAFIRILEKQGAAELVNQKGVIICKILDEKKVATTISLILTRPYWLFSQLLAYKLAKLREVLGLGQ